MVRPPSPIPILCPRVTRFPHPPWMRPARACFPRRTAGSSPVPPGGSPAGRSCQGLTRPGIGRESFSAGDPARSGRPSQWENAALSMGERCPLCPFTTGRRCPTPGGSGRRRFSQPEGRRKDAGQGNFLISQRNATREMGSPAPRDQWLTVKSPVTLVSLAPSGHIVSSATSG